MLLPLPLWLYLDVPAASHPDFAPSLFQPCHTGMECWDVAHVQVVFPKASVGTDTWIQAVNMDSTVCPMGAAFPGIEPFHSTVQHSPAKIPSLPYFLLCSGLRIMFFFPQK